ncbi:aminopeptidase P family protein [Aureibacter tunicatorum]|uniref:Xaa-Pro aminopeptidase n=1 Tax=Aureibacter tunicatorum TaxID=866807 RepID=A0AAE3XPH9_9BACT|nr:aminopeptidase P family protein [Aureibacter tunicatorum]MDR6240260.1 Xaa-Pro aminopeptidase [Aureibacter tunicatorum]BDD05859.1 Xaa-Pro aminopeptidase [Aureibacter tunicatorum]
MRYNQIDSQLFIKNRKRFVEKMKPNSIAILSSNDVMYTNADDVMRFQQNNDLFYLSGVDQEETILLLYPDAQDPKFKEVLFIRETNEHIRIWEGDKLTKEQATDVSGISNVQWLQEFDFMLQLNAFHADNIYLNHNEHIKTASAQMETREDRMIKYCKDRYPLHNYERVGRITRDLRFIKSDIEIELVTEACNTATKAFNRALRAVKPGMREFEVEAELTYEFLKNGTRRHAFQPIMASGLNACSLHYVKNDDELKDGDMILMDFGAEYGNYHSDVTRCLPVNGKFTDRQKEVYNAVLRCLKEGVKELKPGNSLTDYEKNMASLVEAELINIGLLDAEEVKNQDPDNPLYKKYFMHGTAHHLGLDVHDIGNRMVPIQEGMVFTCEPGIYIREERIGIRLENDYVITKDGPVNLTSGIPIEVEEIEAIMAGNNAAVEA